MTLCSSPLGHQMPLLGVSLSDGYRSSENLRMSRFGVVVFHRSMVNWRGVHLP